MSQNQKDQATPVVTATAVTQEPDLTAALAELERLRRENEILRGKLATAVNLPNERGALQVYKVHVEGVHPMQSSRTITPRDNARPEVLQMPAVAYDDLDLFLHEAKHDPARLDEAAWKRFCAAGTIEETGSDGTPRGRPVDPIRDRRQFWCGPLQGKRVDFLAIPAHSPADAFALFCKFCGILKTSIQPVVEVMALDPNPDGSTDLHYLSA